MRIIVFLVLFLVSAVVARPVFAVNEEPLIYCWCKLPETGTCENHRLNDAPDGSRRALQCGEGGEVGTSAADTTRCSAYCNYRGFTAVHCETTFRDYTVSDPTENERNRCTPSAPGGSEDTGAGTTTGRATIPLFNPLGSDVTIPEFIGRGIRAVVGIVGALALLMFVYGGIMWMTSGGSEERVKSAKNILKNSVIGLLLIFFSYTIVTIFFGLFSS